MLQLRRAMLWTLIAASVPVFACDDGFTAFQDTVYKKVRRDCALCHDGSVKKAPPFATDDPNSSYNMLLNYMNFSSIDKSLLVIRAGNGHCNKPNCNKDSGKEMSQVADKWWTTGEKVCERNGKYFTASVPLPMNMPTKGKGFAKMSFNLGTIKNTLNGMAFEIDVQDYIPESAVTYGAYMFRAPRLVGGKKSIVIKDLKVMLNGRYDIIYNAYTAVNRSIPFFNVGTMATPILSAEAMMVLKDGLPNPELMISFVAIDPTQDTASCLNSASFKQNMKPAIMTNCAGCHTNTAATMSERMLDLTAGDDKLCQMASAFIEPSQPMVTPLLDIPAKGLYGHPMLTDQKRMEFVQAYRTWLSQ
jgi:hypothetical protein